MSGPEWNNDEPGNRDDSRPLSGPSVALSFVNLPNLDQAHAPTSEPAMAHPQPDADPDETESTETPARPPRAFNNLRTFLSYFQKTPTPSDPESESEPGEPRPDHPQGQSPSRFPLLNLSRETRVGIGALLSFVILVTGFVVKRGWVGSPPPLALKGPADSKTTPEEKGDKDKDEPKAKGDGKTTDKDKDKDKPEPKPEPRTTPEPGSTEKPASDLPVIAAGDRKPPEIEMPPKVDSDPSKLPAIPAETTSNAPSLPEPGSAKLPEIPTVETVQLPGPPGSEPKSAPAAATIPTPASTPALDLPPTIPTTPEPTPTPTPVAMPTELPPNPVETKPNPVETKPNPVELNPKPVDATSTTSGAANPPPIPSPTASSSASSSASAPMETAPSMNPSAPLPAEKAPTLESIPASVSNPPANVAPAPIEPAATPTSMGGASPVSPASPSPSMAVPGPGWVMVQSGGRRIPGSAPIVSTPLDSEIDQPDPPRVADGPRRKAAVAEDDQFEPVLHTVEAGENFWTISKLYYKSGRYYKALHAANAREVPDITKLYIGTVLKIPPPEKLDRSLIDRETAPVSTKSTKKAVAADVADLAPPVRPRIIRSDPEAEAAESARRRPTYRVKANDTLRSIARETLNDSHRDGEIFDLNRDVLEDRKAKLEVGTLLTLPEDANIRGR